MPTRRILDRATLEGALARRRKWVGRRVEAGYLVLRFTWQDLTDRPDEVVAQIRRSLIRATI